MCCDCWLVDYSLAGNHQRLFAASSVLGVCILGVKVKALFVLGNTVVTLFNFSVPSTANDISVHKV